MTDPIDTLSQFLLDNFDITDQQRILALTKFKPIQVKKNRQLLQHGQICEYAYFIAEGCLRTYFLDQQGQEKTRYVAFENNFVSAFSSFITQTPSAECVQALEDSLLMKIRQTDFYQLVDAIPAFAQLYRQSLEQALVLATWRAEIMLSMTAKERFVQVRHRFPQLVLRLSNKHVASFLGITQESLSRLKATR
jgi:CRP-like cAMP-binding protein